MSRAEKGRMTEAQELDPLRICMITDTFPKLSEVPIFNQIVGLLRQGHEVDVYSERQEAAASKMLDRLPEKLNHFVIPVRPLSKYTSAFFNRLNLAIHGMAQVFRSAMLNPRVTLRSVNVFRFANHARSFWLVYQIWPFIQPHHRLNYDVIHAQFGPNGIRAVLLRRLGLLDAPVVTSFRGYDLNRLPREKGTDFYRELFREGDLFTTDSRAMAAKLVKLGAPQDRIVVVPSSVDLEFWQSPVRASANNLNKITFMTAARMVECKGIRIAIEAIEILQQRLPNIRFCFRIAGDGPLRLELERLASTKVVSVEFAGWVDQESLRDLMKTADAFVLPSIVTEQGDEESQGLVLQEAQAMGLPVVASDIGGISEGLIDGVTGCLCPPGDPEALADAMQRVVKGLDEDGAAGIAARKFVETNYSLESQSNRLVQAYQRSIDVYSKQSEFRSACRC